MLESISDAFFALDHQWRFTYLNSAAERLLDRRRADLLGQNVWQEFPHAVGTSFDAQYRLALAEQRTVEFEEYYPPLQTWFSVRAYPTPTGLSVYFQDVNERRRINAALRESEESAREAAGRLSFVLTAAELGAWEWDASTDLLQLSERAAEIFGIPGNVVCTRTQARDLLDEADRERARLAVTQAAERGGRYKIEYRVNRPDGKQVWVFANGRSRYDASGKLLSMAGIVQDITERRSAQAELEQAKAQAERGLAQWKAVVESMTEGLVLADTRGNLLMMNSAALAMHGFADVDEMLHRLTDYPNLFELRDGDGNVIPFEQWPISRVLRGERFSGFEVSVRRVDSGQQWIGSYGGTPVRDVRGTLMLVVLTLRDVTEHRRADDTRRDLVEKLERQARIFDATLSSVRDYVFLFDEQGRFIYANTALLNLWGLSGEQAIGRSMKELGYPPDVEAQISRNIARVMASGQVLLDETAYTSPSGVASYYEYTLAPVTGAGGRVELVAGISRDVGERRRAEQQRAELLKREQAARAEAERSSRMKDEFLATLSHELRTPLNAILGWSQILADGAHDADDLAEGLKTIQRNARAQTQIIEDLLDMSRIISGKVRLDVQRMDLAGVVEAAVQTVRPAADAKGVRLQVALDPLAGPVSGDPTRLQQVFWNLLSNAVKFTPRDGRVQVLLERVNSHIEVSVIDTGEGITADFLPQVFDRFRQADASTTRRYGGLGLGLAIVKQLVELHGGSVRARSSGPGTGSTFIVRLPLTVVHPEPDEIIERRHPTSPGAGGLPDCRAELAGVKVLVVDDEPDARALIGHLLQRCDAIVVTAASAAEALELLKSQRPDVLISDIGMPYEDGYTLIRRVRALPQDQGGGTPAIALTAYARGEDRVKAVMAGFQHHIAKPVEPAELIAMIASLIHPRSAR